MAKADNYKKLYEDQKTHKEAAQVLAYTAEKSLADKRASYAVTLSLQNEKINDLRDKYSELSNDLVMAKQKSIIEAGKSETAIKLVAAMRETMQDMQEAEVALWSDFDANRASMLQAKAEAAELTRQLSNMTAYSQQLENTNRYRAEQIQAMEEQIAKLNQELDQYNLAQRTFESDVAVTQVVPTMAGVPIVGEISEMDEDKVAISIGSTSGVREDMRLRIVRGDKFLGNLKIIYVEADQAVGRLTNATGVIVEGDMVTTDFN